MKLRVCLAGAVVAAALGSAPAEGQQATVTGYLAREALPNSLTLVPPPPAKGSAAEKRDQEGAKAALALHGGPRWAQATEDANLTFPRAAETFSCALGAPITEAGTPTLYKLLRRAQSDLGRSPYPTKTKYQRARPFMVNGKPQCTPAIEDGLRKDGSYPSGHATIGWGWALILAEAAPDRADAVLARGRAFTDSRRICNVHWLSDVEEGRTMAAAVVARLHAEDAFKADVAAARRELAIIRAQGLPPSRDCAEEAARLAAG
jgi:acid phosphatase (class A)